MAKNNLQTHWQRHDWLRNPFAPDLRIVQALVAGKTASGAGFSRYDALSRCMGETAEIIALKPGESSEGMAAGPDIAFAAEHALRERLERWALWEWWHGSLDASPVKDNDLIDKLRHNAGQPRQTKLWHLPDFPHLHVIIARGLAPDGTQPILGFGAHSCPQKATRSALIELGLMELNLLAPQADLPSYFSRLSDNSERLFPVMPCQPLRPAPQAPQLAVSLPKSNIRFTLHDRTPAGIDLTVIKAEIPQSPSWAGLSGPLF